MSLMDRRSALRYSAASALAALSAGPLLADEPKPKADPYADGKLLDGEPPPPAAGSFTVAVLPDTQHYSETYPATFRAQTEYVAANRKARNIACVLHLGDITNRNTVAEWENAA